MNKFLAFGVLIIVFAMIAGGISWSKTSKNPSNNTISVRLDWLHQAQFAGFYYADKAGFYKDEGLDVTLNPGGMDFPAIQLVASNSDQIGMASAEQILSAREKGVPVVAIMTVFQKNPFVLMALKDSSIDTVQKFVGKKIGVKYGDADETVYRVMLKNAGVNPNDVKEIPAQFDITPLFTRQVDVWPDYVIAGAITAEEKGYPVNIIWPSDYGINMPGGILFTTEKMIKEKPDMVKKFIAATVRGWQETIKNQDLAIDYTLQYNSELNREHETRKLNAEIPLIKSNDRPVGYMDKNMWESIESFLLDQKLLNKKVDINKAYTTEFLP